MPASLALAVRCSSHAMTHRRSASTVNCRFTRFPLVWRRAPAGAAVGFPPVDAGDPGLARQSLRPACENGGSPRRGGDRRAPRGSRRSVGAAVDSTMGSVSCASTQFRSEVDTAIIRQLATTGRSPQRRGMRCRSFRPTNRFGRFTAAPRPPHLGLNGAHKAAPQRARPPTGAAPPRWA